MIETFTALLFAHILADFVFQTNWINDNKHRAPVLFDNATQGETCCVHRQLRARRSPWC